VQNITVDVEIRASAASPCDVHHMADIRHDFSFTVLPTAPPAGSASRKQRQSTEAAVIKFVIVNGRRPMRAPFSCACCAEKLQEGYIREAATGLKYCNLVCLGFSEKMAISAVERRGRLAS
jgi:hypothetical protein